VAATTLKAALATTMQFAASLYEQVAERKGGTYYGRVDGGLLLRRRTTWPFKVPGSSSQARSSEDRWFELNRNCEPYKLPMGTSLDISDSNWNASRWRLHPGERLT